MSDRLVAALVRAVRCCPRCESAKVRKYHPTACNQPNSDEGGEHFVLNRRRCRWRGEGALIIGPASLADRRRHGGCQEASTASLGVQGVHRAGKQPGCQRPGSRYVALLPPVSTVPLPHGFVPAHMAVPLPSCPQLSLLSTMPSRASRSLSFINDSIPLAPSWPIPSCPTYGGLSND